MFNGSFSNIIASHEVKLSINCTIKIMPIAKQIAKGFFFLVLIKWSKNIKFFIPYRRLWVCVCVFGCHCGFCLQRIKNKATNTWNRKTLYSRIRIRIPTTKEKTKYEYYLLSFVHIRFITTCVVVWARARTRITTKVCEP